MTSPINIAALNAEKRSVELRLADIAQALEVNAKSLAIVPAGSYRHQELAIEKRTLEAHRRVAERWLADLAAPPTPSPEDDRRERRIEGELKRRNESAAAWVAKLEAEGDHRQAAIARLAMLDLRGEIEREFNG